MRYPLTPSRLVTAATPSAQRSASRYTPRGRPAVAPATPHGLRARQQRAVNTPGRDRRRSGRIQRETVFDVLKNLGKSMSYSEPPGLDEWNERADVFDVSSRARLPADSIVTTRTTHSNGRAHR